jgi:ubiquinone/menaquinone biosynthesis C-methylase UbiE
MFGPPERIIGPFVRKWQVVADLGCGPGYYKLALAESVGPEGKVYAVDLYEKFIQALRKKVNKAGYRNIEVHASSAADASFIPDRSVDFVFANGLL